MKKNAILKTICLQPWLLLVFLFMTSMPMVADVVVNKQGKCGYEDEDGNLIVKHNYDYISPFNADGLALVAKNNKFGFINLSGDEILPIKYDYISPFNEGFAQIKAKNRIGLIDQYAKLILKPSYSTIGKFNDRNITWAIRTPNTKNTIYLINKHGKTILPPKYRLSFVLSDGSFTGCQNIDLTNKKATYIVETSHLKYFRTYYDLDGNIVFEPKTFNNIYKSIFKKTIDLNYCSSTFFDFIVKDDVLLLTLNRKNSPKHNNYTIAYVYYDLKKQCIIANYTFDMDCSLVQNYEQTKISYNTFRDWANDNMVNSAYIEAHPFNEGYARVTNADSSNVQDVIIDKEGHVVTKWAECTDYTNGLMRVKNQDNLFGIINTDQQTIIPVIYDSIQICTNGNYIVLSKGHRGVLNNQNDTIIPICYNDIKMNDAGVFALKSDTNWSILYQDTIVFKCSMEATPHLYGKTILLESYNHIQVYDIRKQQLSKLYSGFSAIYTPTPTHHGGLCFEVYEKIADNHKIYGYVNAHAEVVLPIIFQDESVARKMYSKYVNTPIKHFTEIDTHRLKLESSLISRKYEITTQIPKEDWGY